MKELRSKLHSDHVVKAPEALRPLFDVSEALVWDYFQSYASKPTEGTITIGDERYILVRASALSIDFFKNFSKNFTDKTEKEASEITKDFLFDLGHVLGLEDARKFHKKMNLIDPISKLSAGPVHFAHSGWANVEILPESNPSPDEHFFLKYHHPYSFEADAWIKSGKKSSEPVCIMNAAYSSGWCEESFGLKLTAVEISCKAKGDDCCTFIMAPPDKIEHYLQTDKQSSKKSFHVPYFFEKQLVKEQIKHNNSLFEFVQKLAKIGAWEFDLNLKKLEWSEQLYSIFEFENQLVKDELLQLSYSTIPEDDLKALQFCFQQCVEQGKQYQIEHAIQLPNGKQKTVFCMGAAYKNEKGKITKIYGIAQDITESKLQHETLKSNLKEKEVLLKEVHHRVKNNLQIISSLLNLQAAKVDNQLFVDLYLESQNRIKSIANVHELLYQSENLAQIYFSDYLKKLVEDLLSTYFGNHSEVKVFIQTNEFFNIDTAVPLGLLLNEIISNSLKHGIENKAHFFIYINIHKTGFQTFQLKVGDNGKGFDYKSHLKHTETLGLMLMHDLSDQLNGELTQVFEETGTHFELKFSVNDVTSK